MITTEELRHLLHGGTVVDSNGSRAGKIGQTFLDEQTGRPAWVTVKTGMFGAMESFVPLTDATASGDNIQVPFTKSRIKAAPRVADPRRRLSPGQEAELYRYYGIGHSRRARTVNENDTEHVGEDERCLAPEEAAELYRSYDKGNNH